MRPLCSVSRRVHLRFVLHFFFSRFLAFFLESRPLLSSHPLVSECECLPSFFLNLPGWRWGSITQNPLVAVSRPLHSGVCETRQDIGLPVLHSEISDSGLLRTRGDQQDTHKEDVTKYAVGVCVVYALSPGRSFGLLREFGLL